MKNNLPLMLVALVVPLIGGCTPNYTQPQTPPPPQTPAQQSFDSLWSASLEVLRQYNFEADPLRGGFQDRRTGVIRSVPIVGQQWFEFWRKDAATRSDLAESSLQTIYRQAVVSIQPVGGGSYAATVQVLVQRSDRPSRWQSHSISRIYNMFVIPGQQVGEHRLIVEEPPEDPDVVLAPLPPDHELAQKIAQDITKAAAGGQNAQAK